MLFSQFPLVFPLIQNGMPFFVAQLIILEPIIILGLRLPWRMNISLVNIWSSLIHLHDFQFWFFFLYQDNKTFSSIRKFRQTNNCCKKVLEAATLDYAHKIKELNDYVNSYEQLLEKANAIWTYADSDSVVSKYTKLLTT